MKLKYLFVFLFALTVFISCQDNRNFKLRKLEPTGDIIITTTPILSVENAHKFYLTAENDNDKALLEKITKVSIQKSNSGEPIICVKDNSNADDSCLI